MTENQIKAKCRNKIELLDSMIPKEVHEFPSNYAILTGGAISSMLRNETPNDYDIFFDNITTLRKVMEYYSKAIEDWVGLKFKVVEYKDVRGKKSLKFAIGIGEPCSFAMENNPLGIKFISNNAISFYNGIQIITRFYGSPREIHSTFDFEHATNYYYNKNLRLDSKIMLLAQNKVLIYSGSLYPIASIMRVEKFLKKGFTISRPQLLKILFDINLLDLTNLEILKDQLQGVYIEGSNILIGYLERGLNYERSSIVDSKAFILEGFKDILINVDKNDN